jgi:hypothetical protein
MQVRDNALVVAAEHVKLIITCDKVIFPLDFEKTEASQRFMKAMEGIIRERPDCPAYSTAAGRGVTPGPGCSTTHSVQTSPGSQPPPPQPLPPPASALTGQMGSTTPGLKLHRFASSTAAHFSR